MASVNVVTLIGNVGKDPEVRYTQKGDAIVSFSLATTEKYNDKEETQWHRVDIFGKLASALKDYITKGQQIYVQGQLVYDNWEDKSGNKRTTAKVKVGFNGKVMLLGGKGGARREEERQVVETTSGPVAVGGESDDIPF